MDECEWAAIALVVRDDLAAGTMRLPCLRTGGVPIGNDPRAEGTVPDSFPGARAVECIADFSLGDPTGVIVPRIVGSRHDQ